MNISNCKLQYQSIPPLLEALGSNAAASHPSQKKPHPADYSKVDQVQEEEFSQQNVQFSHKNLTLSKKRCLIAKRNPLVVRCQSQLEKPFGRLGTNCTICLGGNQKNSWYKLYQSTIRVRLDDQSGTEHGKPITVIGAGSLQIQIHKNTNTQIRKYTIYKYNQWSGTINRVQSMSSQSG